ncbi:hypothetical protein B0I35DRAFT_197448 [Stachybotrys elegans]|uniref:C2H2-type domain-containing protein n=1 Tax=Stachybotrys elegans TaxID=80388 RepID=A0A8K0SEW0_9HYPO|nr:hypothetical protein B0I35DRAFT_197448 [Stachybotrys elegans]
MLITECSACLERFESDKQYQDHVHYHKHRADELLQELQVCLQHISAQPRPIDAHPSPISRSPTNLSVISSQTRPWACPHPDCAGKRKKISFKRRKDLVRHLETHKECEEECPFCGILISRVRKYCTHYDDCPVRLEQQSSGGVSTETDTEMREKRRLLHEETDSWLGEMLQSPLPSIATGQKLQAQAQAIKPKVTSHGTSHQALQLDASAAQKGLFYDE